MTSKHTPGPRRNPYDLYRERDTWTERQEVEDPAGVYVIEREVSRWGGVFSYGPWRRAVARMDGDGK